MHCNRGLRCLGLGLWLVKGLLLCITIQCSELRQRDRERELPISEAAAVGVVVGCTTVCVERSDSNTLLLPRSRASPWYFSHARPTACSAASVDFSISKQEL